MLESAKKNEGVMKRTTITGVMLLAAAVAPAGAQQTFSSSAGTIAVETVVSGLSNPWALEFMPDGRMLVTERGGRMRIATRGGRLSPPLAGGSPGPRPGGVPLEGTGVPWCGAPRGNVLPPSAPDQGRKVQNVPVLRARAT